MSKEEPLHIIELEAENFMRLKAVHIRFGKGAVIIGGKNGAGKSAVLKALEIALGGRKSLPKQPLRKGQRRGFSQVILGANGKPELKARVDLTAAGGAKLTLTDATGGKLSCPQSILNALRPRDAFDPLDFIRLSAPEQAEKVRAIAGVDTREKDADRERLYNERTELGRELKRLKGVLDSMTHHEDAPAEEVSVADLTDELEKRRAVCGQNDQQRRDAENLQRFADGAALLVAQLTEKVAELAAELDRQRVELADEEGAQRVAAIEAEEAKGVAAALVDPNLDEVREQLRTVEDTNRLVRENKQRLETVALYHEAEGAVDALTDAMADIDEAKRKMLAEAKMPLPGLGFDGDLLLLDDVPLSQGSQAQQLRLAVALDFAANPKLRTIWTQEASLLDDESLAAIADETAKHDGQAILERVGKADVGAIIIEDGEVEAPAQQRKAG